MEKSNKKSCQDLIILHSSDNVAITPVQLIGAVNVGNLKVRGLVPAGHKIALVDIHTGDPVRRYNQVIGIASKLIKAGEHVHTHNLMMVKFDRDYEYGADVKLPPNYKQANFMGIRRSNGKVATRNYIGILSTVNCSATVAHGIADYFSPRNSQSPLQKYPYVDGVIALTHSLGCGADMNGDGIKLLQKTIAGYASHPNFSAILLIGLGCEVNQIASLIKNSRIEGMTNLKVFNIQDIGGTKKSVSRGIEIIKEFLPDANNIKREPCTIDNLIVGLQCGGSDAYSGVSANPALGNAVDLLVSYGGTAILSETPEIYGAEHLLTRRAISTAVGRKLVEHIEWWKNYVRINNGTMNNNPSPGNKIGGLTTILEKSLGAVAKGGTSNLVAVYDYADEVKEVGLVFMNTPGYDPVSATGQVAGGANVICFTTGRGSAYGCAPSPSLKISTNNDLWQRQEDDVDINCGEIITGKATISELGQQIFDEIILIASGRKTKSELHGYGQSEFVPWQLGATM
jgi:altronate hydrolase